MKKYKTDEIRNLCFLSHSGVGKTSLIEAMCRACGAPGASGSVDKGTSLFDSRPDEKSRKMTISSGVASMDWKGNKINIIDTPGSLGLLAEANGGIRVSEMSCVLVDAVSGIEVGTEQSTRMIDKYAGRKTFFINGIDKENADFDKTLDSLKQKYGTSVAPVQIPIGSGESFKGIVDLLSGKAFEYSGDKGVGKETEVPSDISESVESIRNSLIESIAESDEELMEKYFEAGELSDDDLKNGLAKGVAQGLIFPLFCGSAAKGMGVDLLLDSIVSISPSPMVDKEMGILKGDETIKVSAVSEDKARAFVFKTVSEEHVGEINYIRLFSGTLKGGEHLKNMTTGNEERLSSLYSICGNKREEVQELQAGDIGGVIKLKETHTSDTLVDPSLDERFEPIDYGDRLVMTAVKPVNTDDDDKINTGFRKLNIEDPLFEYNFYPDIRQSILSGMGDMHLKIVLEALKRRFKVDVETVKPKISYRETITKKVEYVEYTHKKQSGGAGQFARVFIDLEPAKRGAGYEFEDKIVGGVIDQPLRPSVDKGIQATMHKGIFAGYPIVDIKVSLVDGKTHPVDSKDVAFQIAGREVFKKAFLMANPILLEPIDDITVVVPEEYMGDIMGDMSSRRGKISGMTPEGDMQVIKAQVPAAEILEYSQSLRSMSQGRGYYTRTFSHYEKVPEEIAEKVKVESKDEGEEE